MISREVVTSISSVSSGTPHSAATRAAMSASRSGMSWEWNSTARTGEPVCAASASSRLLSVPPEKARVRPSDA